MVTIEPDWLLIYKLEDDDEIIFELTGSRSDLFRQVYLGQYNTALVVSIQHIPRRLTRLMVNWVRQAGIQSQLLSVKLYLGYLEYEAESLQIGWEVNE